MNFNKRTILRDAVYFTALNENAYKEEMMNACHAFVVAVLKFVSEKIHPDTGR